MLKPGGKLLVVNETIKTLSDRQGVHVEGVEQFEGYEHAFYANRYRWEATRAGFHTRVLEPSYHYFFDGGPPPTPTPAAAAAAPARLLRAPPPPRRTPGVSRLAQPRQGRRAARDDRHQAGSRAPGARLATGLSASSAASPAS